MSTDRQEHWDGVYETKSADEVSWFQPEPTMSLRLVADGLGTDASVVDVGAGSATLVDSLLARGFSDLTVVDVSVRALAAVAERLGDRSGHVALIRADLLDWRPRRTFDVWHDRAVFHFLTSVEARARYVSVLHDAVAPGGRAIVATFAPDGPSHCSGLAVNRYDAGTLAEQFEGGFVLDRAERENHTTPAGVVQPFTWVVLHRR